MTLLKQISKGFLSYTPFPRASIKRRSDHISSFSARYCYSVWLRHLVKAYQNNLPTKPHTVAEIGPGPSLGIGIAALLSGVEKYYAFDKVQHINTSWNISVFNELLGLFKKQAMVPDQVEFPEIRPVLDSYHFPQESLSIRLLAESLESARVIKLLEALQNLTPSHISQGPIAYFAPWNTSDVQFYEEMDLIISQAVLEHVDDLLATYETMFRWLKPGGYMSHVIDFRSHNTSKYWNGHWTYSDFMWKIIRGQRTYLLNRAPLSEHLTILKNLGFEITFVDKYSQVNKIYRNSLSRRYSNLSDEDLTTSVAFIIATKPQEKTDRKG